MTSAPLWSPSEERKRHSTFFKFQEEIEKKYQKKFSNYQEFHQWSVQDSHFWKELFSFFSVKYQGALDPVCLDTSFASYQWFPQVSFNFAQNLLESQPHSQKMAFLSLHESGLERKITYQSLYEEVASLSFYLKNILKEGEILGAYMPNIPETAIAMLAASSLGAIFTSTSCDFGVEGVVDRFSESKPSVLVAASGYEYNGKYFDLIPKILEIKKRLPFIKEIIVVDFLNKSQKPLPFKEWGSWDKKTHMDFFSLPFSAPLYIMYSSGTTGKPKCIVHSQGGTLLQHIKELGLHCDLTADKNILFFTTCGWMMWNWLISALFFKSTVILYEGSPTYPSAAHYMDLIDRHQVHLFGTGPKFLKLLQDQDYKSPSHFKSLETLISTGAPLLPEQYDYVYDKLKKDLLLGSISGGTDILGCFMLCHPCLPVYRGEIQCLGMGMAVAAFDQKGLPLHDAEGELVCRKSFPSRPLYFLNDHQNEKMKNAYFLSFEGVWHHGDFIRIKKEGGVVVLGRSDATLNPGGVRIGTAEIYRQTETFFYLEDSLCVGKEEEGDVVVYLFVKMKKDEALDEQRISEIKKKIRDNTTPRHVPRNIFEVSDIPYTRSGKKMELAVARLSNGRELANIEAVANAECLPQFKKYFQKKGQDGPKLL